MLASKFSFKSPQTRFNLLLLEDGEFFLDVRSLCGIGGCTEQELSAHVGSTSGFQCAPLPRPCARCLTVGKLLETMRHCIPLCD